MPEFIPADDGQAPPDLLPATGSYPTETVRYQTVVLTDIPDAEQDALVELNEPVDLGKDDGELKLFDRPGEGLIITTEQRWRSLGVTLGRLLHSLALAPGESTRVAVVDWTRRDKGARDEGVDVAEKTGEDAVFDRSVAEVANSVALEQQFGDSTTGQIAASATVAATGGVSLGIFSNGYQGSLSSSMGAATAVARSSGTREVAGRTAQDIAGRTRQVATAVRNQHVAVVQETDQVEGAKASTRVVTNYNHMHALTMQYYEVVQVYEVTTKPVQVDRCLFIPMKILTFTTNILKRYADVLALAAPKAWKDRMAGTDPFQTKVAMTAASSGTVTVAPGATAAAVIEIKPGKFKHLAASADAVWGLGLTNGQPERWDPPTNSWVAVPGLPAEGGAAIAVGGAHSVWVTMTNKDIYRLEGQTWTKIDRGRATGGLVAIAAAADGAVWGSGPAGGRYRRDGSNWEAMGQDVGGEPGGSIAAVGRDVAWCLHANGQPYEWNSKTRRWDERGGVLTQIAGASDGSLWGVNAGNDLYQWNGAGWDHRTYTGAEKLKVAAPVSGSELWALTPDGSPVRILTRDVSGFEKHDDKAEAAALTVWWDKDKLRGIQLTMRGATGAAGENFNFGETDPALQLNSATHKFPTGDRLIALTMRVVAGNLRQIVVKSNSGEQIFGEPVTGAREISLDVRGSTLCGLFGEVGSTTGKQRFLATLGFWVRAEAASADILDHLNDNAAFYSRVIWAHAGELELSRMLATYHYTPESKRDPVPLAVCLDPQPVAITGNYLAFRWHFASTRERRTWLEANVDFDDEPDPMVLGLPGRGVFAEAVLGRANSAEKLDATRFWNWQDSPIPVLASEIAPVSTDSRAVQPDLTPAAMAAPAARINPLQPLPEPAGLEAILRTVATANLFRDMSGLSGAQELLGKSLELAASSDQAGGKNATAAMKIAADHLERMADLAIEAAPMLLGPEGAVLAKIAGADGIADAIGGVTAGRNITEYGALHNTGGGRRRDRRLGTGRRGLERGHGQRARSEKLDDDSWSDGEPGEAVETESFAAATMKRLYTRIPEIAASLNVDEATVEERIRQTPRDEILRWAAGHSS
ncbi:hypothetical protein E1218_01180 [Kribbella turkmenica]|uniref:Uncharacterized protein n=1 Tax=Kribbella turkmenica TaxID=2530375 RepID=A0A4R4XI05_9ACTN|nr:tectonin domain-containing protein [Kribbella turkmenica]TDD30445.1 hypothetical protein E1218_01180 [Kribbella turkmenica]